MKAEKISLCIGLVVIVLLAFVIVWKADIVGVSAGGVEQNARVSQDIEEDWEVAQASNEDICAMLFYDKEETTCIYSVYLSKEGMSYGYFFNQGGEDAYITENVKALIFEGRGIAVMSMNVDGVSEIVTDSQTIQVDSEKPFVVLLPIGCGDITLYDAQKNIVTLYDTYTG